jgi:hypothetical protein
LFGDGSGLALSPPFRADFLLSVFFALQFFGHLGVLFDLGRPEIQSPGTGGERWRRRQIRVGRGPHVV